MAGLLGAAILDASQRNWSLVPNVSTYRDFPSWTLRNAYQIAENEAYRKCIPHTPPPGVYWPKDDPRRALTPQEREACRAARQNAAIAAAKKTKLEVKFRWDPLRRSSWDLSRSRVYSYANWVFLLLLIGPLALAKAIDWIAARKK